METFRSRKSHDKIGLSNILILNVVESLTVSLDKLN